MEMRPELHQLFNECVNQHIDEISRAAISLISGSGSRPVMDQSVTSTVSIPAEILAAVKSNFNETEIKNEIKEIRAGRGTTFEQCIKELESVTSESAVS